MASQLRFIVTMVATILALTSVIFWRAQALHEDGYLTIQIELPFGWREPVEQQYPARKLKPGQVDVDGGIDPGLKSSNEKSGHPFADYQHPHYNNVASELNRTIGPIGLTLAALIVAIGLPLTREKSTNNNKTGPKKH